MQKGKITISAPQACCGCTACASVCSHDAISMVPDALGFLYPMIDESKCVECGLCKKVCQFNDDYDQTLNLSMPIAYAVRHKDVGEVMKSRSGAAFMAISDYVLEQGGVVYGAGYKDHFRVAHKRATTKKQRDEFRGSKYVQSDLTGVFRQVKEDLRNGIIVLFSGTPCQTSGLNSFVGKKLREKLILIDIICHGVPGPFLWRDYISYLEKKKKDEIVAVNFRDKSLFGWAAHKESFKFKNDESFTSFTSFTSLFYKHIMFRHSCGVCHFTNLRRPSDITLGDFWGWERNVPDMNVDDKGVNLVILNTEIGKSIFSTIKDSYIFKEVILENSLQPNLIQPSIIHPMRMDFERAYITKGFEYAYKCYADTGLRHKIIMCLRKIKKMF